MLKAFLTKLLVLLLPFAIVIGFFEYNLAKIPTSYSIKKESLDAKAAETEILILGTSHAIVGINPAFLQRPAFNMADTSQSLYYDLGILLSYKEKLKNLKVVIIPVSYFSLAYTFEQGPEYWRAFFYDRFYGIPPLNKSKWLDARQFSLLALYGQSRSILYASKLFRVNLAENITETGYQESLETDSPDINKETGKQTVFSHQSFMNEKYLSENTGYLETMVRVAKEMGALPVLATLPVSRSYSAHVNATYYTTMIETLEAISKKYNIPYFNHFEDANFGLEDFADVDHLNSKGAEKFTKMLRDEYIPFQ